jgi:hypothetical protein
MFSGGAYVNGNGYGEELKEIDEFTGLRRIIRADVLLEFTTIELNN